MDRPPIEGKLAVFRLINGPVIGVQLQERLMDGRRPATSVWSDGCTYGLLPEVHPSVRTPIAGLPGVHLRVPPQVAGPTRGLSISLTTGSLSSTRDPSIIPSDGI